MKCPKCSYELKERAVYCNNCGQKVHSSIIDPISVELKDIETNSKLIYQPPELTWKECRHYGDEAFHRNDFYEAIEYYEAAVNSFPTDETKKTILSNIYNQLGICSANTQKIEKAMNYFNVSISINPNNFKAFGNRASLKTSSGDDKGAIQDIEVIFNKSQMEPYHWYIAGVALENLREFQRAKLAYEQAIEAGFELAKDSLRDLELRLKKG